MADQAHEAELAGPDDAQRLEVAERDACGRRWDSGLRRRRRLRRRRQLQGLAVHACATARSPAWLHHELRFWRHQFRVYNGKQAGVRDWCSTVQHTAAQHTLQHCAAHTHCSTAQQHHWVPVIASSKVRRVSAIIKLKETAHGVARRWATCSPPARSRGRRAAPPRRAPAAAPPRRRQPARRAGTQRAPAPARSTPRPAAIPSPHSPPVWGQQRLVRCQIVQMLTATFQIAYVPSRLSHDGAHAPSGCWLLALGALISSAEGLLIVHHSNLRMLSVLTSHLGCTE